MTVKSVIEIDVLDEKFKAFQAAFEKYKKSVDEQSKKWKEFNKTLEEAEKRQKAFNKAMSDGATALKGAVGLTASIASNMASAAISAAKWLTYGAIGGGFGLGGLASGASTLRREATGFGVSTSQLRAARTYGEAYVPGIESVMAGIQRLQTDVTKQALLGFVGGDISKNAFQNLPDVIKQARSVLQSTGGDIYTAKRMTPGLEEVFSDEQLQTLFNMSAREAANLDVSLRKGESRFKVDEADYENWRQFFIQLKEAGNYIENKLIIHLKTLGDAFSKISVAVVEAIDKILSNDRVIKFLNETLPEAIKKFADYLTSPEFKADIDKFLDALAKVADAAYGAAQFLGLIGKSPEQKSIEHKNASDLSVLQSDIQNDILNPVKNKFTGIKMFRNQPADLSKVDPKLLAAIQSAGLTVESGYRTQEYAELMGIWHPGSHHTVLNKEGYATGVDVNNAQLRALRAKFKSEEEFNRATHLYAPFGKDPNELNHLEYFDPNANRPIYVNTEDGTSKKAGTMAGTQRRN